MPPLHADNRKTPPAPAEEIAEAYLKAALGDAQAALLRVVADALADLSDAERRDQQQNRLVSYGYVRGRW